MTQQTKEKSMQNAKVCFETVGDIEAIVRAIREQPEDYQHTIFKMIRNGLNYRGF
jgi:hypothetical protein